MADPYDPHRCRLYQSQYEDAEKLFDDDDYAGCIELAKKSLT